MKKTINNSLIYYIVLITIFIAGTIVGAILIKVLSIDTSLRLINVSSPYINIELSVMEYFRNTIILNYLFLAITFIFGLFNLGFLSTILIFFRGNLLGLTVGFLIQNQGIKGFLIAVFSVYPQYIIYLPCIIMSGALSILFDKRTNLINRRKSRTIRINLSEYVILFILLLAVMTTASIYEGFISPLFF